MNQITEQFLQRGKESAQKKATQIASIELGLWEDPKYVSELKKYFRLTNEGLWTRKIELEKTAIGL